MPGKTAATPFLIAKHMIVGLCLETMRREQRFGIRPEKRHPVALITLWLQSHPNEMHVIWHQTVAGTNQSFADTGVNKQFPKRNMKVVVQPSGAVFRNRERPMNNRVAAIKLRTQTRQIIHSSMGNFGQEDRKTFRHCSRRGNETHFSC